MIAWLVASVAWAGGFEITPQGGEVAGMASAGTALVDRADSAWFNPAALADGAGFRTSLGLTLAQSTVTAQGLDTGDPWSTSSTSPLGTPPHLALSYAQADWAVSLSGNVPFGGGVVWPEGWRGRYIALASQPQFFRGTASFAYRLGIVRLAASFHADGGSLLLRRATDHVSEDGSVTTSLRGWGLGGGGSLLITPGDHASVGVSYKSRTALRMAGEADFDVPVVFQPTLPDQHVRTDWTLPDRLAVGFAWRTDTWTVALDASVTLWAVNDELVLDFEQPQTDDSTVVNGWRTTAALRMGAEGRVHEFLRLRGGIEVDGIPGAPAPDDRLSPSSPDSTRLSMTVGISVDPHPLISLHGWAQPMLLLPRRTTEVFAASYEGYAVLGGMSVTLKVPPPVARRRAVVAPLEDASPTPSPTPAPEPDTPFDPWDKPED